MGSLLAVSVPTDRDAAGNAVVTNVVAGKDTLLKSTASFPVISAAQGKIVHHAQSADEDLAIAAIESAAQTFTTYKTSLVDERRMRLLQVADLFEQYREEAISRQIQETSCSELWAGMNVTWVLDLVRECAATVSSALVGEIPPSTQGSIPLVYKVPVGVVLIIPPWNAALALAVRGVVSALAAGCTVILKASELCPWTHRLIVTIIQEAGFPQGSVNMVMADRRAGPQLTETLIAHPAVRKVEFVGSASVGRIIGSLCGRYLKPCLMELGDQSPLIVLEDADLQAAADACTLGALIHHGQVCFATERVIVRSEVREQFQKLLIAAMDKFGPISSAVTVAGAQKAKAVVDEALSKGAKLIYGSGNLDGTTLSKSILANVSRDASLSKHEGFAPTIIIDSVDSDEQAIEEANSRSGGLSASVYTNDLERGIFVAHELEFGQVQINNMTMFSEPSGPVSCYKGSGWGSNGGVYGIAEFLVNKRISLHPKRLQKKH